MSFSVISPTGLKCDLLSRNGHHHHGQIDLEQVGTRDFFTEHGEEVRESVFQEEAAKALLGHGQAHEELILAESGDHQAEADPEELAAEEMDWGMNAGIPLNGFRFSTEA